MQSIIAKDNYTNQTMRQHHNIQLIWKVIKIQLNIRRRIIDLINSIQSWTITLNQNQIIDNTNNSNNILKRA